MPAFYEIRRFQATLIFDLKDQFARTRGTRGHHPRPFEPIRFFATAKGTGPNRRIFEPPLELLVRRNGGGYHIFHNLVKQADGTILKGSLTVDVYDLRIEGPLYQTAERLNVKVPPDNPEAVNIDLFPAYSYPFPTELKPTGGRGFALLRGSLHSIDGGPLSQAMVSVVGANSPYVSDESGQWVLVFPDSFFAASQTTKAVTVQVTPLTGPVLSIPSVDVAKGGERSLSETAFRGWVVHRGIGVGGATVEVQGRPGQSRTAADGSWFYYFGLDHAHPSTTSLNVTATLPDGSTQTQNNQQLRSRATVVVPPFRFP